MTNRTVIAVSGTANVGKSMTLSSLGRQLQAAGATTDDSIEGKEYRAIFNYRNLDIGIQTFGDIESMVADGLDVFQKQKCDIIAVASKRYGNTVNWIENFTKKHGYRLIWTAPYEVSDMSISTDRIKDYTASHFLLMIEDIISDTL